VVGCVWCFLGRINEVVYFLPFSETELKSIVQRELQYWQELVCCEYFGLEQFINIIAFTIISSLNYLRFNARIVH
jgi:hypothetical protein